MSIILRSLSRNVRWSGSLIVCSFLFRSCSLQPLLLLNWPSPALALARSGSRSRRWRSSAEEIIEWDHQVTFLQLAQSHHYSIWVLVQRLSHDDPLLIFQQHTGNSHPIIWRGTQCFLCWQTSLLLASGVSVSNWASPCRYWHTPLLISSSILVCIHWKQQTC